MVGLHCDRIARDLFLFLWPAVYKDGRPLNSNRQILQILNFTFRSDVAFYLSLVFLMDSEPIPRTPGSSREFILDVFGGFWFTVTLECNSLCCGGSGFWTDLYYWFTDRGKGSITIADMPLLIRAVDVRHQIVGRRHRMFTEVNSRVKGIV